MTRQKWTKLRRTYPQLFERLPPWEKMNTYQRAFMKPVGVKAAISRMHSLVLSSWAELGDPRHYLPNLMLMVCFNPTVPHPDTPPPPVVKIPGMKRLPEKWTFEMGQFDPMRNPSLDPGYPPQDYTVVNGEYQPVKP